MEEGEAAAGKVAAVAAATAMAAGEEAAVVQRRWVVGTWCAGRGLDAPAAADEPRKRIHLHGGSSRGGGTEEEGEETRTTRHRRRCRPCRRRGRRGSRRWR